MIDYILSLQFWLPILLKIFYFFLISALIYSGLTSLEKVFIQNHRHPREYIQRALGEVSIAITATIFLIVYIL